MPPGIDNSKCVLIIGATAGIGRALALAIRALPSKPTVIVAGRRQERLDELVRTANDELKGVGRIEGIQVDVSASKAELKAFVDGVVRKWPELDTVIFSAGIQNLYDFTKPESIDIERAERELNINYLAIFSLITFFLPHLLKVGESGRPAFLIPISSGLAIAPLQHVPNYCATKAALHSLSLSLHTSLAKTNVYVMEILPPLVESELHDDQGTTQMLSKVWMTLADYIPTVIAGLRRGDLNIVTGEPWEDAWERLEKGRIEMAEGQARGRVKLENGTAKDSNSKGSVFQ